MTRLTADHKKIIADNAVLKSSIPARQKVVNEMRLEWAENVRLWVNGDDEKQASIIGKQIQKLLEEMPDGFRDNAHFLPYATFKRVKFDGQWSYVTAEWGHSKIVRDGTSAITIPRGHELEDQYEDIEEMEKAINDSCNKIRAQVYGVIEGVTTVAKLLKVWPESRELLPPGLEHGKSLPAIPVADLNATLGLPSDKPKNPPKSR